MITHEYDFLLADYSAKETEFYLHEVVRSKYDRTNILQINKALELAKQVHKPQKRCDNRPFIIHPERVALMLVRFDRDITSKVFIAALLHDTLEDTCLSYEEIANQFGEYVAQLVKKVTRRHNIKTLQEKREAKLQKWEEVMKSSHEARAINTFEDLDNMICWKAIPKDSLDQKKIPRWLTEAKEMSLPLARATNLYAYNLMQEEYSYYVEHGYENQTITM